ncbi:MAG: preprotein translocase subunit YajC [bacterium]|nr:preprotein translocase subunit YajC [bacterium]
MERASLKTPLIAQLDVTPGGQSPAEPQGGILGSPLLFIVAMLLIMYALIIRPQQRKEKEHKTMLAQVAKGDVIVTSGGIHGKVTGVTDDVLTVEIANNVRVKLNKSAIGSRVSSNGDKS